MQGKAKRALSELKRPDLLRTGPHVAAAWLRRDAFQTVEDPATGEAIAEVSSCSAGDVSFAVERAAEAFGPWSRTLPRHRGEILTRWARAIRENEDDLAVIATCEQGKPLAESRGEVAYAADFLDWYAGEAERAYGETLPSHLPSSRMSVLQQPVGATVAITPWNFPLAMITRKAGAALAAGCTMIVKSAPETPLSALALAVLAEEANFPPSVLQFLTGDAPAVASQLLREPAIRAFSFTGSTGVGRLLLGMAAPTIKRASLELGGNAPFLVFADADLDRAVSGAIAAKFATSGQDCLAANRIYVQRKIYPAFVEAFSQATAAMRTGHGLSPETGIGPMTRPSAVDKCRRMVEAALRGGARVAAGGMPSSLGERFVEPTVLYDVDDAMDVASEEVFGPVAAIAPFDVEEEVIRRANATEMGLAAYVYTDDLNRTLRVTEALQYGMVAVNTPKFTGAPIPFGGWKQSGLGREGSRHGMSEYLEPKYVCIGNVAAN